MLHLASVELIAKPKTFQSSEKNASSLGIMYYLQGNAKALSEEQQREMFELISDEEIQKVFNDPFHLKQSKVSEPQSVANENNLQTFATVSRPTPKPVVKASTQSLTLKPVVKASATKNKKPWDSWESEDDTLAWGLEQLLELIYDYLTKHLPWSKILIGFIDFYGIQGWGQA